MKKNQIAAQAYTIREYLKTPKDIAQSMARLKKIGFDAVQLSGLGSIDVNELKGILDGEGLLCCATHEPADTILTETQKVVDRLKALNCSFTAYPYPKDVDMGQEDKVIALAKALDKAGALLRENSQTLTYHNHQIEFRRLGKKLAIEILYDESNSQNLKGEIDTYWVQFGGASPVEWCKKLANRLPLLHLKDYRINESNTPAFAELGQGNLNIPAIIEAAGNSGCEWYIIEQDNNWIKNDPFESLRISYSYLESLAN